MFVKLSLKITALEKNNLYAGRDFDQLLGARMIKDGTGKAQAVEAADQARAWKCEKDLKCTCTDTTTSNTGVKKGAAVELEKLLGRQLIYLACRHHELEIIIKNLFDKLVESSSSPDIGTLCKNFKKSWPTINQTSYVAVSADVEVHNILTPEKVQTVLDFALKTLEARNRISFPC